jgi:hypothetical protein
LGEKEKRGIITPVLADLMRITPIWQIVQFLTRAAHFIIFPIFSLKSPIIQICLIIRPSGMAFAYNKYMNIKDNQLIMDRWGGI